MIEVALRIVKEAFKDKVDKSGEPYMAHLLRVAENSKKYLLPNMDYEEVKIVSLLHDLLEDCDKWTKQHLETIFGLSIAEYVYYLTKKKGQDYDSYINTINNHPVCRVVKLADLEHNMDIKRLKVLTDSDLKRLAKYHASYVKLLGDFKINSNG